MDSMDLEVRDFVREFEEGRDYPAVASWWMARGMHAMPARLLPKCGVVACRELDGPAVAAGWLFMDNSVPLGRIEFLVTRPGLSLAESRRAVRAVLEFLERTSAGFGYVTVTAYAHRGLAREAKACGWRTVFENLTGIIKEV